MITAGSLSKEGKKLYKAELVHIIAPKVKARGEKRSQERVFLVCGRVIVISIDQAFGGRIVLE